MIIKEKVMVLDEIKQSAICPLVQKMEMPRICPQTGPTDLKVGCSECSPTGSF